MANKAPGGFGLGTTPQLITDWNDAKVGGWFWSNAGAGNAPDPTLACFGTVYNEGNPEVFVQEVWGLANVNKYYHWMRLVYPGTGNGTPWEWPNPPMLLGVEYRTTERYLGKPVYVMAVDFGSLPNSTIKTVTFGDSTIMMIGAHGIMRGGYVIPGCTGDSSFPALEMQIFTADGGTVGIFTHTDRSSFTAVIVAKYWKTTD